MSEAICSHCRREFDGAARTPRILPNCGHTFCSGCLQKWLEATREVVVCPEDRVASLASGGRGLAAFPVNYSLASILRRGEEAAPSPLPGLAGPAHFCTAHRKPADMVCLTDRAVVCAECVLFDLHRGHSYARGDDFVEDARRRLGALRGRREQVAGERRLAETERRIQALRLRTVEKREELGAALAAVFSELIAQLRARECELRAEMQERLSRLDASMLFLHSAAQKLKERERRLQSRLQSVAALAAASAPDFNVLLEEVYGDEPALERELAEVSRGLTELDAHCRELVERELDRFAVRTSGKALYERLAPEIEVEYYAADPTEPSAESRPSDQSLLRGPKVGRAERALALSQLTGAAGSDDGRTLELIEKLPSLTLEASAQTRPSNAARLLGELGEQVRDISRIKEASLNSSDSNAESFSARSPDEELLDGGQHAANDAGMRRRRLISSAHGDAIFGAHSLRYPSLPEGLLDDDYRLALVGEGKPSFQTLGETGGSAEVCEGAPAKRKPLINPAALASMRERARPAPAEDLTVLDYSNGGLTDAKLAPVIAEATKRKQLRVLRLDHNAIGEAGFAQLIKKLGAHPALESLSLVDNAVDESALKILKDNAKRLKRLTSFDLRGNKQFRNLAAVRRDVAMLKKSGITVEAFF